MTSKHTAAVLADVAAERANQDAKWGADRIHPDGTGLGLPVADTFRQACDDAAARGEVTWLHIWIEEMAEAMDEKDPVKLRGELVQGASVLVAWIESIDLKAEAPNG